MAMGAAVCPLGTSNRCSGRRCHAVARHGKEWAAVGLRIGRLLDGKIESYPAAAGDYDAIDEEDGGGQVATLTFVCSAGLVVVSRRSNRC